MPKITPLGWIGIIILFNTTLIGGASQLSDLFLSPVAVKAILAVATLGNGFLGGLVTMFSTPQSLMDTVGKLPSTTVVTSKASADALPDNKDVVAVTPEIVAAIKKVQ